jgi:hypothetical protein
MLARFSPVVRSMPTPRTHSISTKVTEAEYKEIAKRADPQTVSTWARGVLLNAVQPDPLHFLLLAELLALRAIVLNLNYELATSGLPAPDTMRRLIDKADADKFDRAEDHIEKLRQAIAATRRPAR